MQWFSYPCTCSWQPCLSASGLDHLSVPSAGKWRGSNPLSYLRERLLSMASELLQCINNNAPHPHMLPGSPVQETYWSLHPTVSEVLLFLLTFQCGGSLPPCSLDGRFRSEWKVVVPCPWRDPRSPFREDSSPLQVSCGDWHRFHQGWNPSLAVLPWDLPVPLAFRKWACVCYSVSSALLGGTAGYRYWQDKPFFPYYCSQHLLASPGAPLQVTWPSTVISFTELMSVQVSRWEWCRFPLPSLISNYLFLSVPPTVLSWIGGQCAVSFF